MSLVNTEFTPVVVSTLTQLSGANVPGKLYFVLEDGGIYLNTGNGLNRFGGGKVTASTTDLTSGSSALDTGSIYTVYE
jgi:hypothetical protein